MQKRFKILIYIILSSMLFTGCAPQYSGKVPPKVVNGEIDLTGWDFEKDGPVKLDGEWLFAWEKFVEPGSWEELQEQMEHTLPVPGYWNTLADPANPNQKLPGTGYASFAVHIKGILTDKRLGLLIDDAIAASELITLDRSGNIIDQAVSGEISQLAYLEVPLIIDYRLLKLAETSNVSFSSHVLLIRVSNHNYYKGGIFQAPNLGRFNKLEVKYKRETETQSFMLGVIFIISLYHLSLFFFRPEDKTSLYFALSCLIIGLRLFSMGIAQRAGINNSLTAWLIFSKIEYCSMPLLTTTFCYYLYTLNPGRKHYMVWLINLALSVPLVIFVMVSSPLLYPKYLYLIQLHMVFFSVIEIIFLGYLSIKKNIMAQITLLSFLIVLFGIINDILNANGTIESVDLVPYTFIIFVLLQSGLISSRSAKAYRTAEHLSSKLSEEVELQTEKHKRIQDLTKDIQNSASLEDFYQALKMTLRFIYKIKNFGLLMVSPDGKCLELFDLSTAKRIAEKDPFKKRKIDLTHPGSLHAKVLQKKKSYVFKRVKSDGQLEENEQAIIQKFNMTALYLLPLVVADQVFATFSIFDTKDDQLSYVANLALYEREELEQLSSLISAGLYQHLQREQIEMAQIQLKKQTAKLNRIQYLSQQIQNTSNLDKMVRNLNQVLVSEFNISTYSFLLLKKEKNQLENLRIESVYKLPVDVKEKLYDTPLDLSHSKSLFGAIVKRGKAYFLSRLLSVENSPDEMHYREWLGMKSLFFLPLKLDGKIFACLSMTDTKFQEQDRIRYLTKDERNDIEQLSQFVSSALYQALQKEQIEKAQAAASRAKNEAAISQLAAHLAHEVNNPLNYIATGKIMQGDSFDKYHEMILGMLTGNDEDSLALKEELESLQAKFKLGLEQTGEGQDRIAKVVAEIRAITGVDGLNFSNFDLVPIINEELIYSLQRNQVKSGEQSVRVTGTNEPLMVLSNPHILARSIRTVISNCIHFARAHKGNEGELNIDCKISNRKLFMNIGNNSFSIKNENLDDLFDLEKSESYGTEQIGLAMIKELLQKVNCDLVLADHGRESGKVVFQLQVPLES